ncbi:MAG: hypothetical protein BWY74_03849 [Firmicutes bacterium ADurb.Bin419]|nr:MAG: hypothetical protein BWY74_03849 [Firmicutes bacterium ADurb.Bin419]
MEIKPLEKYKSPKYPVKYVVLNNPNMLKNIPNRWKGNAKVGIALSSLLLFTLTACSHSGKNLPDKAASSIKPADLSNRKIAANIIPGQKVSPIFEHGEGSGSFGCVSVSPPAFLSEEEALGIIVEEASKYGLTLHPGAEELETTIELNTTQSQEEIVFSDTTIIDRDTFVKIDPGNHKYTRLGKVRLDGGNEDGRIYFEYVSVDDFKQWNPNFSEGGIFFTYDIKKTAQAFVESIMDKTDHKYVGTFYDPMPLMEVTLTTEDYTENEIAAISLKASENELREQVRDFICWLKAEGVI